MFRLQLDCGLIDDENAAKIKSEAFLEAFKIFLKTAEITQEHKELYSNWQFRLMKDGDRGNRNYMIKQDGNHMSTRKCALYP